MSSIIILFVVAKWLLSAPVDGFHNIATPFYRCSSRLALPTAQVDNSALKSAPSSSRDPLSLGRSVGYAPSPLDKLIGVNLATRSVVFEVSLGKRQLGFDIIEKNDNGRRFNDATVGEVQLGSQAALQGMQAGDRIVATSATAGESMWAHNSVESVRSAVTTRFVLYSTIKLRLERSLDNIDPEILPLLKVPEYYKVQLKPPIGLKVTDHSDSTPNSGVFVEAISPDFSAGKMQSIRVGDEIVSMSASWGSKLWDVCSVEAFMTAMVLRRGSDVLTLGMKRMVPLQDVLRQRRPFGASIAASAENQRERRTYTETRQNSLTPASGPGMQGSTGHSLARRIDAVQNATAAKQLIQEIVTQFKLDHQDPQLTPSVPKISTLYANKLMTTALKFELAADAVELFETLFGFRYADQQPLQRTLNLFKPGVEDNLDVPKTSTFAVPAAPEETRYLTANSFVCTTAMKAYGRLNQCDKAVALLPWFESKIGAVADIYLMSALLYVCAKHKRMPLAEQIFWEDIPARELRYTSATVNSLMYMYAILKQPEEALRTYELMRSKKIECTAVTYGILIKALIGSSSTALHTKALEILAALPSLGIEPGTPMYNQLLEHYGRTHNFRKTKSVLKLMSAARPRVKPDVITYGHVIHCFAYSKKPHSALRAFEQMRAQHIVPNGYTYMGVLRALAHMRDAFSAVQVIHQMQREGLTPPDKNHYAMAMFACVNGGATSFSCGSDGALAATGISNTTAAVSADAATSPDVQQCELAESLVSMYLRQGGALDAVICTLWLRALLQQTKWVEGYELLRLMQTSSAFPRPNSQTYACLLQYQILAQRWEEGSATLSTILSKPKLSPRALHHTTTALHYCLGSYSSEVCQRYREDYIVSQKYAPSRRAHDRNTASSADKTISTVMSGAQVMTAKSILGTPHLLVPKPTAASLGFAVQAVREIRAKCNATLPGKFYSELQDALRGENIVAPVGAVTIRL